MTKGSNLVIVESPSKAKTIGKYLGPDYRVEACMGHLRDLPKSKMGVDLEHDFEPDYQPLASKAAIISELRSASKAAKHIYLATDPDREGEAISWHLKELLELPDDKTERVTFNEITKNVVTRSIQEPRGIDYNLVDAQQARRILDRIVGYQLSPLLWKKIRRGLSAGRVQSVATRLVVEREQEIEAFVPKEYWTIDVLLRCLNKPGSFTAHYYGEEKKRELHSEAEADEVLRDIAGQEFTIAGIKRTEKRRSPTPPFITSTLQQEASRKLNMTPRSSSMRASTSAARAPSASSPICVPTPCACPRRRWPLRVILSPIATARPTIPASPAISARKRARRTRTRPFAPAMSGSTPRAFRQT